MGPTFSLITAAAGAFNSASSDGKIFSAAQAFSPTGSLLCNAWSPQLNRYAALGSGGSGYYAGPDAALWTPSTTTGIVGHYNAMVNVPSKSWFCAAAGSGSTQNQIALGDGDIWNVAGSLPSLSPWTGLDISPALGSGNGRIVVVGTNVTAWSDDGGQNFTAGTISAHNWKSVKWVSWLNLWIATGNTTVFATSSDGKIFTDSGTAILAAATIGSIAVSPSLQIVCVMASSGVAQTSSNLSSWTNTATPGTYTFVTRSEALGLFVGFNGTGSTGYSPAGTSWTPGTTLASDTWGSLAVADNFALLSASSSATGAARASSSGSVIVSGRSSSAARATNKISARAGLFSRSLSAAAGRTSLVGGAALVSLASGQSKHRATPAGTVGLLGREGSQSRMLFPMTATAAMAALVAAKAKASAGLSGVGTLSSLFRAGSKSSAKLSGAAALSSLFSVGKAASRGALSGIAPLFVNAAAAGARAKGGFVGGVQLFARSVIMATGFARTAGTSAISARSQASGAGRATGSFRLGLTASASARAQGRIVISGSAALAARAVFAAFGRLLQRAAALFSDPRFIGIPRPRGLVARPIPRNSIAVPVPRKRITSPRVKGQPVPQCPDFSPIDPNETVTNTFDLAPWLPTGVTIASISSVSCAAYLGTDAGAAGRIVDGGGAIGPSPSTDATASAVLFQVGNNPVAGVVYRLQATIVTSDGQTFNPWAHQACQAPN